MEMGAQGPRRKKACFPRPCPLRFSPSNRHRGPAQRSQPGRVLPAGVAAPGVPNRAGEAQDWFPGPGPGPGRSRPAFRLPYQNSHT